LEEVNITLSLMLTAVIQSHQAQAVLTWLRFELFGLMLNIILLDPAQYLCFMVERER